MYADRHQPANLSGVGRKCSIDATCGETAETDKELNAGDNGTPHRSGYQLGLVDNDGILRETHRRVQEDAADEKLLPVPRCRFENDANERQYTHDVHGVAMTVSLDKWTGRQSTHD